MIKFYDLSKCLLTTNFSPFFYIFSGASWGAAATLWLRAHKGPTNSTEMPNNGHTKIYIKRRQIRPNRRWRWKKVLTIFNEEAFSWPSSLIGSANRLEEENRRKSILMIIQSRASSASVILISSSRNHQIHLQIKIYEDSLLRVRLVFCATSARHFKLDQCINM